MSGACYQERRQQAPTGVNRVVDVWKEIGMETELPALDNLEEQLVAQWEALYDAELCLSRKILADGKEPPVADSLPELLEETRHRLECLAAAMAQLDRQLCAAHACRLAVDEALSTSMQLLPESRVHAALTFAAEQDVPRPSHRCVTDLVTG